MSGGLYDGLVLEGNRGKRQIELTTLIFHYNDHIRQESDSKFRIIIGG
jgi:hypothetical protein